MVTRSECVVIERLMTLVDICICIGSTKYVWEFDCPFSELNLTALSENDSCVIRHMYNIMGITAV